ncbi:peptidoglycan-binding protein [Streptomyces sp. M41]|uniref:peptidoglycan-binding domain-containing protein n=1 Tax=Streptomyces sp. M41 TaxID=3059412 RepID=UPI00374DA528
MSEALRDARTAQAAAAEDFDPLRIRPYVELEGDAGTDAEQERDPAETMPLRPVPPTDPVSAPGAPGTEPSAEDISLFEPETAPHEVDDTGPAGSAGSAGSAAGRAGGRRRRTVLLGVGGGVVAVLAAAGLASGLLAYETPSRDRALPKEVRASVPDAPAGETEAGTPPPSGAPPRTSPPAVSPSRTGSASTSPTPSDPAPVPTPSASAPKPTNTPSATEAGGAGAGAGEESPAARETAPAILGRGDRGPEVVELELRLTQLGLYTREPKGTYTEAVEDAVARFQWARGVGPEEYGVYDAETRELLESETREP